MSEPISLVIGHGSIGERHARVLAGLGHRVALVSRRSLPIPRTYEELDRALAIERPEYVVVATETSRHLDAITELAALGFTGRVLVEKPLLARPDPLPPHRFSSLHVGYNLRFHPLMRALHARIGAHAVLSMNVYVGQHLSTWRPGRDHRSCASAVRGSGGVIRDLSHELDTVRWLVGPWRRLTAIGGCFGSLEIDSDDAFGLLLETERCPLVSVQMNYLDRIGARTLAVVLEEHTVHADLVAGTLRTESGVESFATERDATYRAMHLAILSGESGACDAAEGLATVATIDAAERAAFGTWVRAQP